MAFPETRWIWKDGGLIPWQDATLHVMSHVVHYGSSIFEGLRCYDTPEGPSIFRLDEHIRRFEDSAKIYRMPLSVDAEAIRAGCLEVIGANELRECYLRPVAFRSYGAAGVNPKDSPVEVHIVCWPWGAYLGADALAAGVDVCISSWARPAPNTLPVMAKAGGNYLSSQLMKMEAEANGYAEAIGLSPQGLVSEGSGQNLFAVTGGRLITPPLEGTLLAGITRDTVITLAEEAGIPVEERGIPREFLYTADELFFAGTAAEITPIRSVDRIRIGKGRMGPITRKIQRAYLDIVRGQKRDSHGWRTIVPAWSNGTAAADATGMP